MNNAATVYLVQSEPLKKRSYFKIVKSISEIPQDVTCDEFDLSNYNEESLFLEISSCIIGSIGWDEKQLRKRIKELFEQFKKQL